MKPQELLSTLQIVKPALSTLDFVPILKHFCFENNQVYAYNDVIGVRTESPIDLDCAIPGSIFTALLGSFSSGTLELSNESESEILVKCGRSRSKLATLPKDDYLFKFPDGSDSILEFDFDNDFIHGLEKCLLSVGYDPTHPEQMGITLSVQDGEPILYSTDNKTLSRYKLQSELKGLDDHQRILPVEFCEQLVAIYKKFHDPGVVVVGKGYILADFDHTLLFSKLINDLNTPDYEAVFNSYKVDETQYIEIPSELEDALNRALILLKDVNNSEIKISINKRSLFIRSSTSITESSDTIPLKKSMESMEFVIDGLLLQKAIMESKKIGFQVGSVLLKDREFTHLVSHYVDA